MYMVSFTLRMFWKEIKLYGIPSDWCDMLGNNLCVILFALTEFGFNKKKDDSWRAIGLEGE
jgi:hypothetical protein